MTPRDSLISEILSLTSLEVNDFAMDASTRAKLEVLTEQLVASLADAGAEVDRYVGIPARGLGPMDESIPGALTGRTVLVTGGTGCIGHTLLGQARAARPARLVSVSRGQTRPPERHAGVEYLSGDTRDADSIGQLIERVQPDVIFHLAAQREPGLAEHEVRRTIATNIVGTRNVMRAAARAGTSRVVYASSGKAMRPFSSDVYTSSKRMGEYVTLAVARETGLSTSATRFTHVVDNSIIMRRLTGWCNENGIVRLFGPHTAFYVQSARESAQTLMVAAAEDIEAGSTRIHAIRDMDSPVSLTDLALGVIKRTQSRAVVCFFKADQGYESKPYPGLYDPMTAWNAGPLLNSFEAPHAVESAHADIDQAQLEIAHCDSLMGIVDELDEACRANADDDELRTQLRRLSVGVLDATVAAVPHCVLRRVRDNTAPMRPRMTPDHLLIDGFIESTLNETTASEVAV